MRSYFILAGLISLLNELILTKGAHYTRDFGDGFIIRAMLSPVRRHAARARF